MIFVNVGGCRITFCIFFFLEFFFISIEIFQKIKLGYMNIHIHHDDFRVFLRGVTLLGRSYLFITNVRDKASQCG